MRSPERRPGQDGRSWASHRLDGRYLLPSKTWVVVLEAHTRHAGGTIDERAVQQLLAALPHARPVALHSPERYAVQVHLEAGDEASALRLTMAQWRTSLAALGVDNPRLLRAEVLTLEEFERDCRLAYDTDGPTGPEGDPSAQPGGRLGDRLLWQVFHDPLTNLPGRLLFMNHLEHELVRARRVGTEHFVVVLGIQRLGTMNAELGGSAGDEVLVTSAQRLRAALPPESAMARIGGGEFAVLVRTQAVASAVRLASRVLRYLGEPVLIGEQEVALTASAGIVPIGPDHGSDVLLEQARAALRAAGGVQGRVEIYRPGLPHAKVLPSAGIVHDPLDYLLLLQRAAMAANESSSLAHAAGLVVSQVCAHLGWSLGHLYVVSGDGRLISGGVSRLGRTPHRGLLDLLDGLVLCPGQGPAGRALATGQPAWVTDIAAEGPLPWSRIAGECGLNAALAFPVVVGREVVAVLEFFAAQAESPDDTLLEVLRSVGSQLGRVVERRRGHADLQASEDRMRQAQTLALLGSWRLVEPGNGGVWTAELCDILGVPLDSPHTHEAFMERVHPEDRPVVDAATETMHTTGRAGPVQFRIVRPDGALRWVSARTNSVKDEVDGTVAVYGTILDITHVKTAEQALRDRERQLNMAEQVAQLGSWQRDVVTNRLEWSDGMYRLWEVERGHFVPTLEALVSRIHPDDRQRMSITLRRAAQTGGYSEDFRAVLAGGSLRWFRGRGAVECDDHGRPVRLVGTFQDVTQEKLAEEHRRTSEEQ